MKKILILFDVDGTIGESGCKINNILEKLFSIFFKIFHKF